MQLDADAIMQQMLWETWAQDFDRFNEKDDGRHVVEFLASLRPMGRFLELGVGTGRVAIPLSKTGCTVVGVDVSPSMLDALNGKPDSSGVETVLSDMVSPQVDGVFQCVYIIQSTLFQVTSQERQIQLFENVAALLAPDGRFVVQASVPQGDLLRPSKNVVLRHLGPTGVALTAVQTDSATQSMRACEVQLGDPAGSKSLYTEQRYVWPSEMDLMARLAGLKLITRGGGHGADAFDRSSTMHMSVYGRAEAEADDPS